MTCDVRAARQSPTQTGPTPRATGTPGVAIPTAVVWRDRLMLLVLLSGSFMVVLDFFIVQVALPSVPRDLHVDDATLRWVVAGYGFANAAGLVTGGRLGDLYGCRSGVSSAVRSAEHRTATS